MNVKKIHAGIVTELKAKADTANRDHFSDSYTGSSHYFYAVSVPERRAILKALIKEYKKEASVAEWLQLVDTLIAGKSHEEKTMGAYLLGYVREAREAVGFPRLNRWLSSLVGWAEVDALCQNVFQAEQLLADWKGWSTFLKQLAKDKNIHKRRAALVLLVGPTWKSDGERLHQLAYANIETLKHETDILITKAVSWLLRSMADTRPKEVANYLTNNTDSLPKIAVRETKKKLTTGKKN